MKKILRVSFFLLTSISGLTAFSQTMEGAWYLIQATRVDGSRILYRWGGPGPFMLVIKDTKMMSVDTPYHHLVKRLGADLKFKDEKHAETSRHSLFLHSDSILVVTETGPEESDKLIQYFYFNSKNYVKAIHAEIKYENESTILANDLLFPYDVSEYINDGFSDALYKKVVSKTMGKEGAISGYFTITKDNVINDIQVVENRNFAYTDKLTAAMINSGKGWELPMAHVDFKVPFTMAIEKSALQIRYRLNDFEGVKITPGTDLTERAIRSKQQYGKGTAAAKRGNFEKAIEFFTETIKEDDYFMDAYYNRAYAYIKLNKKEMACQDWKALKDLGQVNGEKLYNENCH